MKGLLVKDLKLMTTQKIFLVLLLFVGVLAVLVSGGEVGMGFGYVAAVSGMLPVTTINYDSFDNGYPFIFTLPISRREYVKEKYVLALSVSAALMIVMDLLMWIVMTATGAGKEGVQVDYAGALCDSYTVVLWLVALFLPVFLKFGAEKAKYIVLIIFGVIAAVVMPALVLDDIVLAFAVPEALKRAAALLAGAGMLLVSYRVSVAVMERKEF